LQEIQPSLADSSPQSLHSVRKALSRSCFQNKKFFVFTTSNAVWRLVLALRRKNERVSLTPRNQQSPYAMPLQNRIQQKAKSLRKPATYPLLTRTEKPRRQNITPAARNETLSAEQARWFTGVLSTRGLLRLTESIRVLRWANIPSRNYRATPVARRSREGLR
jgi:hypothetical protein